MKPAVSFVVLAVSILCCAPLSAAELPKTIQAAACQKPPTIDGAIGDDEWKDAKPIEFEMAFIRVNPFAASKRLCQLRVMNSANGLYVALRVPDETVNKTLAPLDIDFAILAFCRGKELAAGDDRKAVGPGIYIDKHLTAPGKDADDARQDGKGAMTRADGVCTIEWALPLDSGDNEDVQARPGDGLRFNLAYFDAFQPDLKETQAGSAFEGGLDNAANWGTLQLAVNVTDDGGAAFQGPAWVAELFKSFASAHARRLKLIESQVLPAQPQPATRVLVEYMYRDPKGKEATGKAKLYLPAGVQTEKTKFPLVYGAGYELDDGSALARVAQGYVVVTPRALEANPLIRTVNPDAALLHIARSLPFIDDSRVVIAGGSAGGYITLMLAAETFPLAGAVPAVPPVNWGYNTAYFLQREQPSNNAPADANAPKTPVFDIIVPIAKQALTVYGEDPSDKVYFAHSPVAHLDTITCPVSVYFSTADMLVPIDQVGPQWVRPLDPQAFPRGFTMNPEKLTTSIEGRVRLIDLLPETSYEVFVLTEENIKQQAAEAQKSKSALELPVNPARQWSITILDEGAPEPNLGHAKNQYPLSPQNFITRVTTGKIPAGQLTLRKLERLMDRYAGREWLRTALVHLDESDSERADVARGLMTYVSSSPENARTFGELYGKLPARKRVLSERFVGELVKP